MTHGGTYTDFREPLDTFDEVDGVNYLWASAVPEKKYEVVALLDCTGDETDDPDLASGGVVKIGEENYMVFTFPGSGICD